MRSGQKLNKHLSMLAGSMTVAKCPLINYIFFVNYFKKLLSFNFLVDGARDQPTRNLLKRLQKLKINMPHLRHKFIGLALPNNTGVLENVDSVGVW